MLAVLVLQIFWLLLGHTMDHTSFVEYCLYIDADYFLVRIG